MGTQARARAHNLPARACGADSDGLASPRDLLRQRSGLPRTVEGRVAQEAEPSPFIRAIGCIPTSLCTLLAGGRRGIQASLREDIAPSFEAPPQLLNGLKAFEMLPNTGNTWPNSFLHADAPNRVPFTELYPSWYKTLPVAIPNAMRSCTNTGLCSNETDARAHRIVHS